MADHAFGKLSAHLFLNQMMRPLAVEETRSMTVTEETLEALFVINKKAKQYARRATEAYEQGFGGFVDDIVEITHE